MTASESEPALPVESKLTSYEEIDKCVPGAGVNVQMGVECIYRGCKCLDYCDFVINSSNCTTCTSAYENGCLKEFYLTEFSSPVMECNSNCTCGIECSNRLSQRPGPSINLTPFHTNKKGIGVKCETKLCSGTYLGEYLGEIISASEACVRLAGGKDNSCYILQYREHLGNGRVMTTNVDATHKGNVMRFINHSCDPNVVIIPVRVNSILPKLCLFTNTVIKAGEELCFSYLGRKVSPSDASSTGCKPCLCGSSNCIGYLPLQNIVNC